MLQYYDDNFSKEIIQLVGWGSIRRVYYQGYSIQYILISFFLFLSLFFYLMIVVYQWFVHVIYYFTTGRSIGSVSCCDMI
jgi:hypothetical protein